MKTGSKLRIMLFIYLASVLAVTQLPIHITLHSIRLENIRINFTPFYFVGRIALLAKSLIESGYDLYKHLPGIIIDCSYNFVQNIFLFMPLGVLLPMIKDRYNKYRVMALISALISVSIELLQAILSTISLTPRICDMDDVIANTLGGVMGLLACRIIKKVVKQRKDKCKAA